jgi:hypothetical protein
VISPVGARAGPGEGLQAKKLMSARLATCKDTSKHENDNYTRTSRSGDGSLGKEGWRVMWRRSTASGSVQDTSRGVDAFVREPGGLFAQRSSAGAGARVMDSEPSRE